MLAALTGPIGSGKSTTLLALVQTLEAEGRSTAGIICLCDCREKGKAAYSLLTLSDKTRQVLALTGPEENKDWQPYCKLRFSRKALKRGNEEISRAMSGEILIIDEIGLWELSGGGWSENLHRLHNRSGPTVLGLRQGIEKDISHAFGLSFDAVVRVNPGDSGMALVELLSLFL